MSNVIAIFGPTGSGKTDVAVRLAAALGTEVVNTDPAQAYDGLPILTNKPTGEHDAIAPHRMVGVFPLTWEATVVEFAARAHDEIDALLAQRGSVVVAGGSGLYMRAALSDLAWGGDAEPEREQGRDELREEIAAWYDAVGGPAAWKALSAVDLRAADQIHPNDRKRVIRAWEAFRSGGSVAASEAGGLWDAPYRHPTTVAGLLVDRGAVRERIAARTRAMFEAGVLDEVAGIVGERGEDITGLSLTALRLHGLSDCIGVLHGDFTVEQAQQQLIDRTRQYVKRQDIWARRWPGLWPVEHDVTSTDAASVVTLLAEEADTHAIR